MDIEELHTEWLRLGGLACVKATETAYKDLRDWEAAHADAWNELIAYDLEKKKGLPADESAPRNSADQPTQPASAGFLFPPPERPYGN